MSELSTDPTLTKRRISKLAKYFIENVLKNNDFICPFYEECRKSHQGIFYEGQLHHIGNHYDTFIDQHPFRVMVVGQEYGHGPSHVSMEDRSQMVLDQSGMQKTFSQRNSHMRGTTSVLRLLFGIPLGGEHADEFLQFADSDKYHIFDAFALVNYLLCSAVNEGEGRRGKSTPVMHRNCLVHFKKSIEILEPTIVIVQGKSFWSSIRNAFSNLTKVADELYVGTINQQKTMIAVFTHPSTPDKIHNWGRDAKTPYLLGEVVPTIGLIRKGLIADLPSKGHTNTTPTFSSLVPSHSQSQNQPYDEIYEQITAGLKQRFPIGVTRRKPEFKHTAPNRLQIYLQGITGAHYEICFRTMYYEFALHFESTPAISLKRRQAFDPYLLKISNEVGQNVKADKLENNGWMRIWYEQNRDPITEKHINRYIEDYSRFIKATFPILESLY